MIMVVIMLDAPSIAGDDTIFIVIREGVSHEEAARVIQQTLNVES